MLGVLPLGDEKYILVGRTIGHANVEVGHSSVSLVHAAVINSGSKTFVQDLGSKHGTTIDGVALVPQQATEVKEGSNIVFGLSDITYCALGVTYDPKKAATSIKDAAASQGRWASPPWATPPSLVCELHDSANGKTTPLEKATTVLGRHGELSDVVVPHDSVSRRHAAIVHREDESFLYDLGSTHGTFLDQARIEANRPVRLDPGARIKVGTAPATFVFRVKRHRASKRPRQEEEESALAAEPTAPREEVGLSQQERDLLAGQDIGNSAAVAYDPLAAIFSKRNLPSGSGAGGGGGGGFSWADALK